MAGKLDPVRGAERAEGCEGDEPGEGSPAPASCGDIEDAGGEIGEGKQAEDLGVCILIQATLPSLVVRRKIANITITNASPEYAQDVIEGAAAVSLSDRPSRRGWLR